jgi:OOP family OmpA-OmpF porin
MKNGLRISSLAFCAALCAFSVGGSVGCKATVTTGEATPPTPPTPPPAPTDTDSDGIADADDACKDKAGPKNDDKAKNGCPEEAPPVAAVEEKKVKIVGTEVTISEKILFDVGKSTIKPESDALMNEIAEVVKTAGKDIDLIEVAGHADIQGDEKNNLKLTDDRAKAVVEGLVKRGVDAKKLRAKGYGQYCPIDEAKTPEAYEKNRRVSFTILKLAGKPTGAAVGCDAAVKKGVKPAPVL